MVEAQWYWHILYRHVTFDLPKNTIPNNLLFSCSHLRQSDVTNDLVDRRSQGQLIKFEKMQIKDMKVCRYSGYVSLVRRSQGQLLKFEKKQIKKW